MGSEFTFYDYIDADGDGSNIIKSWLDDGGKPVKANYLLRISQLEASPPRGFQDTVWQHPYVDNLKGEWKDFIEIRVTKNSL